MFSEEEIARYSSQIILPQIGAKGQLALKNAKILLVGCGGLGSACALYLATAGVGNITLIDQDQVELKNLQRQILYSLEDVGQNKVVAAKQKLQAHNPHPKIQIICEKFEFSQKTKNFEKYDLILDCSDNQKTKRAINRWSLHHKTVAIFAGAVSWHGFLFSLLPFQSACYECLYSKEVIDTPCSEVGVVGALVGVIGCMQAVEAMKILLGVGENHFGVMFFFDGFYARDYKTKLKKKADCPACCAR
jgi:molybdopterin/thiamine biosynthesis adenylyltransferase